MTELYRRPDGGTPGVNGAGADSRVLVLAEPRPVEVYPLLDPPQRAEGAGPGTVSPPGDGTVPTTD